MSDFLDVLESIEFFDSFSEEQKKEYSESITARLEEGLAGPNAEYFKLFPGLAFVVTTLEMEFDSVETDVEELAEETFGMFDANEIQVVGEIESPILEFELDGEKHVFSGDVSDFQFRAFEFVASRFGQQNALIRPHAIVHPSESPGYHVVLCTPSAKERMMKKSLVPTDRDAIQEHSLMEWVED